MRRIQKEFRLKVRTGPLGVTKEEPLSVLAVVLGFLLDRYQFPVQFAAILSTSVWRVKRLISKVLRV